MTRQERQTIRKDISETFDFLRYIIANPKFLRNIRNGTYVHFLPPGGRRPRGRPRKNAQYFIKGPGYYKPV